MRKINLIVVLGTGTGEQDIGVHELERQHRAAGFLRCRYHYVIKRDGEIETGRDEDEPGVFAGPRDKAAIAVAMVGDANYTELQYAALETLLDYLLLDYTQAEVVTIESLEPPCEGCPAGFDMRLFMETHGLSEQDRLKNI